MGMRPDGLALDDRVQIWKSMVLPTIPNGIHFMSPTQARALQLDINKSLRSMSASTAHPLALAAEFGILQVEVYRLRATANLFTICFTICLFISPDLDGHRAPKNGSLTLRDPENCKVPKPK